MNTSTHESDLKHLVLVGGGHAQVAVLKDLAMRPIAGLRITLISRDIHTPYSGMLPGYLEGLYDADEITIDLSHLARAAGARFIAASVEAINPSAKTVTIKGRPPLYYDVLSVNIGSITDLDAIKGAREHALAVKPISTLLDRIAPLLEGSAGRNIAIIGGGAAGVETALALKRRLAGTQSVITLIHRGQRLVSEFAPSASKKLLKALSDADIKVHLGRCVEAVEKGAVLFKDGSKIECDLPLILIAGAPPTWLKASGLALDARGFIKVKPTLEAITPTASAATTVSTATTASTTTTPTDIFASGDIASLPRPKAGVFAVRAGKYLAINIRRKLEGKPLKQWHPQKRYLALIGLGARRVLAIRGGFCINIGRLGWLWKEALDRKFIHRFTNLPPMNKTNPNTDSHLAGVEVLPEMQCLGCGAKAGFGTLHDAINAAAVLVKTRFPNAPAPDIQEDSADVIINGARLIQSVDALSAIVDDAFLLGRIAAHHALSDLYASHAEPKVALATLTLPRAVARLQQDDISQIMAGAMLAFAEEGVILSGGHTSEAGEMQVGFTITGYPNDEGHPNSENHTNDDFSYAQTRLILTKPLGIGTIMAGHMTGLASGAERAAAIAVMAQSNSKAAAILNKHGYFAMTDVTGFGLARHLLSLLGRGQMSLSAEIDHASLPLIDGVARLIEAGVVSSLMQTNRNTAPLINTENVNDSIYYDPQTGGGLLAIVPEKKVKAVLADSAASGVDAVAIGSVVEDSKAEIRISPPYSTAGGKR